MAKYTVQVTGTMTLDIVFIEIGTVIVTVGQGGSIAVGDVTVGPGMSETFYIPVGQPFVFEVLPLPTYRVAVTVNGVVIQPDAT